LYIRSQEKRFKRFERVVRAMQLTLKTLRINKGLRQADMAAKLNVNRKTISAWEKGKSLPAVDMIDAICELFGVSYDDIKWKP
jgi:DNA-binding XRE family transcriptional regulator